MKLCGIYFIKKANFINYYKPRNTFIGNYIFGEIFSVEKIAEFSEIEKLFNFSFWEKLEMCVYSLFFFANLINMTKPNNHIFFVFFMNWIYYSINIMKKYIYNKFNKIINYSLIFNNLSYL